MECRFLILLINDVSNSHSKNRIEVVSIDIMEACLDIFSSSPILFCYVDYLHHRVLCVFFLLLTLWIDRIMANLGYLLD